MRIAILGYGTRGDIQPLLPVAAELQRRGHSVVMTVNVNLARWAEQCGVAEVISFPPDTAEVLRSDISRRLLAKGKSLEWNKYLSQQEIDASDEIVEAYTRATEGADVVVSTVMTFFRGDALAEKLGIPHLYLALQPVAPTRAFPHALVPLGHLGLGILNEASYRLMYNLWWRTLADSINAMRRGLGLPELRERRRFELTLQTVQLFSEHVVPRPTDWPARHSFAGFTPLPPELRERLGEDELPEGLDEWLDAGTPPVFFGFGSMPVLDPLGMLDAIAQSSRRRGYRALVGAGWSDFATTDAIGDDVFVAASFDHDRVLPRCRAAVHHGGAGTTHSVLAAGLPSLVCAVFADQPFWGRRVEKLEVGAWLPFPKLTPDSLDPLLSRVLDEPMKSRAERLGKAIVKERGHVRAAETIEAAIS